MNNYNFDENANDVINFAFSEARDFGHRYIGTEHLLLGLSQIKGSKVHETFSYYHVTAEDIRRELIKLIGKVYDFEGIVDYTLRAKECLERSHVFAMRSNNGEILPEHMLMSILSDKESIGYKVLAKLSLDLVKLSLTIEDKPTLNTNVIKVGQDKQYDIKVLDLESDYTEDHNILNTIGINLTELSKDHPEEQVVGRTDEIERLIQILTRKNKNNPCLIGEPGVGKTAIVRGLALKIASGEVPEMLKGVQIYEVSASALVAGTMYRGQFEERMNELIQALIKTKKAIVFFDEIHNLVGAGATGEKSLDAFAMLKPYLTQGTLQLIGTSTYDDYQKFIEKDAALSRRLVPVPVEEPSREDAIDILLKVKANYEKHHDVIITDGAVVDAVELSVRYLLNRKLPDKAIDIIDEACSRKRSENLKTLEIVEEIKYRLMRLKEEKESLILSLKFAEASKIQQEEKRILNQVEQHSKAKAMMNAHKLIVDRQDVEMVISEWSRVPISKLSTRDMERLGQIDQLLKQRVFGQDYAVSVVSKSLRRFRLGIKDVGRPIGCYLFVGPTGVGKTELAKTIAEVYYGDEKDMIRFDMSEYMERHSVSKLIGSPPGYEGMREGGLLTNAIAKGPFSVVVFDEVEKAHPDVVNILLQLMDEGRLTDGRGRTFDFRHALIILTSNLGIGEVVHNQVGFIKDDQVIANEVKLRAACEKFFKPEFINRLDEIVVFKALELEELEKIVEKQMRVLKESVSKRGLTVDYDEMLYKHIAEVSYNPVYGARPIKRAIDVLVKDPLAEWIIQNERSSHLLMELSEGEIVLREKVDV